MLMPVLKAIHFDRPTYSKTINKRMGGIFREGVRTFVRVILQSGIPVETGMAKAALLPIGQFLNNIGGLGITPVRKPYFSKTEGVVQSVEAGEAASKYTLVDDRTNDESYIFLFEWEPGVLHFWNSEFYKGKVSGEPRVEYATKFMNAYINVNAKTAFPNLPIEFV